MPPKRKGAQRNVPATKSGPVPSRVQPDNVRMELPVATVSNDGPARELPHDVDAEQADRDAKPLSKHQRKKLENELKKQAAEEAARDPVTVITAAPKLNNNSKCQCPFCADPHSEASCNPSKGDSCAVCNKVNKIIENQKLLNNESIADWKAWHDAEVAKLQDAHRAELQIYAQAKNEVDQGILEARRAEFLGSSVKQTTAQLKERLALLQEEEARVQARRELIAKATAEKREQLAIVQRELLFLPPAPEESLDDDEEEL